MAERLAVPAVIAADRRLDQTRAVVVSARERQTNERSVSVKVRPFESLRAALSPAEGRLKPDATYVFVRSVRL